ncbi:MAG: hypothetical protein IJ767_05985 [Bacteroidaceae bacterium]|nr:hypothetical protein [Bacteroidaceae bacterium]
MKILKLLFVPLILFFFTCCEKAILDEEETGQKETTSTAKTKGNVTLCMSELESQSFQTIAKGTDKELPNHLCFVIYDMGGNRLKQVNQTSGMADFGQATFQLDKGTYQLVLLAHSSAKNPTMTNLSKVQFNNSIGYTDTYMYYSTLTVGDQPLQLEFTLDRIVALCRFVISDPIPEGATQMRFTYTGGSGHFSALTGLGITNSKQVVTRMVQAGQQYQVFDLYTFLPDTEGTISLAATALDAAGNDLCEWEYEIPMAQNQITWLTGNFFTDGDEPPRQWTVTPNIDIDSHWGSEVFYTY